jgi:SAM-dependent methyltransferase
MSAISLIFRTGATDLARRNGETKAELLAKEVAKAVNAGKVWDCETVDFADPCRPQTCLEVDFPILPINQIAAIEGKGSGALKPVYQGTKWWARRRSSVFRAMLIAGATKAPKDPSEAAKQVWDAYYGNHQKKGAFKHLKVADIFMGGGTTIVEGARLGMQMYGNDLNPVAWFVVKNEMARVEKAEVEALLADIEREVKPQIMPFYACGCPRGHKGKWTKVGTDEVMGDDFDPVSVPPEDRKDYSYEGPEIIYVFWAKHGPCQVTGCGHRTPIMTNPVMAVKTISVKYWDHQCPHCNGEYELEEQEARMAPGVSLIVANTERPYVVGRLNKWSQEPESANCPLCSKQIDFGILGKPKKKKIDLTLLVHPNWLQGEPGHSADGREYGGSADDPVEDTVRWNQARAAKCSLLEVRGKLPDVVTCPETGITFKTGKHGGTVPNKGNFVCMAGTCGRKQDVLDSIKAFGKDSPVAMYAIQGYCHECDNEEQLFGGRFFMPVDHSAPFDVALSEWEVRKDSDLKDYWPKSKFVFGQETLRLKARGYSHWWKMFNARQLLVHASILKSIDLSKSNKGIVFSVLGAFQQYLRNQNMFCFWNIQRALEPMFSNNNYHPKTTPVENSVFSKKGRGDFKSSSAKIIESNEWLTTPWEIAVIDDLGHSHKVDLGDEVLCENVDINCCSSSELASEGDASYDLVITDPPFGGIMQYAELSDFFYVWLRLVLKDEYSDYFSSEYTPNMLEVVANRTRQPGKDEESNKDNADIFYQRLLTACWKETHRILKPGGLLAFTFHHSEDAPWVAVLESLFDAGFYLVATYPIRGDETKGDKAQFGSKKIEYDIIHVCRKRMEDPQPKSWAKMRRQVLHDVRRLQEMLEHHLEEGLPEADLQVIRRGKALEYFSRHYGKVYQGEGVPINVLEALVGINQLLDEEAGGVKEPPPHNAEPFTRMFLRLFDGKAELARDQMQKFLRGTGSAPSDFVNRGWCFEKSKVFHLTPPLDIARDWQGRHRKGMNSDYDQAAFLIGACFEGSGINANETLSNPNFKPHPALSAILTWHRTHGSTNQMRNAAAIASSLYRTWESKHQSPELKQMTLFFTEGDE